MQPDGASLATEAQSQYGHRWQPGWLRADQSAALREPTSSRRLTERPLQIADGAQEAVGRRGLAINQAVQAKAVLERQHDGADPGRVQRWVLSGIPGRRLDDIRDQLSPGAQALGELGSALFGARHKQDHLHVQKWRPAEWILSAPVHSLQRIDEIGEVLVPGEKIKIASNGLLDVILEHGDDQLVLALEVRIERAAGKIGRASCRERVLMPV